VGIRAAKWFAGESLFVPQTDTASCGVKAGPLPFPDNQRLAGSRFDTGDDRSLGTGDKELRGRPGPERR
jgi:hypothetical protein